MYRCSRRHATDRMLLSCAHTAHRATGRFCVAAAGRGPRLAVWRVWRVGEPRCGGGGVSTPRAGRCQGRCHGSGRAAWGSAAEQGGGGCARRRGGGRRLHV
eukprot:319431-Chlamydomonas_euryale.AAC.1